MYSILIAAFRTKIENQIIDTKGFAGGMKTEIFFKEL